jgi:hypothetical protein
LKNDPIGARGKICFTGAGKTACQLRNIFEDNVFAEHARRGAPAGKKRGPDRDKDRYEKPVRDSHANMVKDGAWLASQWVVE